MKTENRAVILMAYGGPGNLGEVEGFLSSVFGQKPSPEIIKAVRKRYAAIGGKTPLIEDILRFSKKLENILKKDFSDARVFPAFRFSKPSIEDTINLALSEGKTFFCGIPFTSFHSEWSYEGYRSAFKNAISFRNEYLDSVFVEPYYSHELLINHWIKIISSLDINLSDDFVIFSAHSLPLSDASAAEVYPHQIEFLSSVLSKETGISNWSIGYQSAGRRGGVWLEPSLLKVIEEVKEKGFKRVVVIPLGFLSESVETLYDLDIEARTFAQKNSLEFLRAKTPLSEKGLERVFLEIMKEYLS